MSTSQTPTKPYLIQPAKKSIFGSGYNEAKKKKLEGVQIPSQTRCRGCKRLKKVSQFSNKQLTDLRNYLAMGYTITDWGMLIDCRQCTGVQIHEMTCAVCEETKDLDGFSKAQRHNPDNARCLECVDEHLYADPTMGDEFDDSSDDECDDENDDDEEGDSISRAVDTYAHSDGGDSHHEDNPAVYEKEDGSSAVGSYASRLNPMPKASTSKMAKSSGTGGKFVKMRAERPVPPQSLRSSAAASSKGRQVKYDSEGSDEDWGILP